MDTVVLLTHAEIPYLHHILFLTNWLVDLGIICKTCFSEDLNQLCSVMQQQYKHSQMFSSAPAILLFFLDFTSHI